MGIGFSLVLFLFIIPIMIILLLCWILTKKKIFGKIIALLITCIISILLLSESYKWLTSKKEIHLKDYYGEYIINREYFPGNQSDWQYNSFRFEIKENDSIYFYYTDKEKILKTYKGTIYTDYPNKTERLFLTMTQPSHHIITSNPTTYRNTWSFYLVFKSTKFNNVFFKKGHWEPFEQE